MRANDEGPGASASGPIQISELSLDQWLPFAQTTPSAAPTGPHDEADDEELHTHMTTHECQV